MEASVKAQEILRAEIEELTRKLAARQRALELLNESEPARHNGPVVQTGNKYLGWKVKDAIIDRLEQVGRPLSPMQLVQDLAAQSCYLGKYPARNEANLKIAVTQNPRELVLKDGLITLKAWKGHIPADEREETA